MISNIDYIQKEARDRQAAIKIFDSIEELRLSNDNNLRKRWLLELVQNAKDMPNDSGKVDIKINLDEKNNFFMFSHNGKVFDLKNLYYLIEQVSTKERDKENTEVTGKFGTGFITTHLLSEIVQIEAVIFDGKQNREINLEIDRSGKSLDEISMSLNKSIEQMRNLERFNIIKNFDNINFNTIFKYKLDADGLKIAEEGVQILIDNIEYIFAFCPSINSIEIINYNIKYCFTNKTPLNDNLFIYQISERNNKFNLLICEENNLSIALPIHMVNNIKGIKKINENVSRLYCDLPLIGTENFSFPAVINNHLFNVTEPRDGIRLTNINDNRINYNKRMILNAVNLLENTIDFLIDENFANLFYLIDFKTNLEAKWLDDEWLKQNVTEKIHSIILNKPIVHTHEKTVIKVSDAWFPFHENSEVQKKIWELISVLYSGSIPNEDEYVNWSKRLWKECKKIQLKTIAEWISDLKDLKQLNEQLNEIDSNSWLNDFYKLLDYKENHVSSFTVENRNVAYFPNQNGRFCKKDELYLQEGDIEDKLKSIAWKLGYSFREKLLDVDVKILLDGHKTISQEVVVYKIRQLVQEKLNKPPLNENTKKAFKELFVWFMDNKELAEDLFGDLYINKHKLCDDTMLAEIFLTNDTITKVLEKHKVSNLDELDEILSSRDEIPKTRELVQADLINLGIADKSDLEKIIKDIEFLKEFSHESIPSFEMLKYSKEIIERSIRNVIKHLKSLEDYDCSEYECVAPTIISGIRKKGVDITLVVRPADNGKVIIYYESEKNVLEHEDSELWIDDNKSEPRKITLGEVLKVARITRIPIKEK